MDHSARPMLDELTHRKVPGLAAVVLREGHLLSHASGLGNPIPVRWVRPEGQPGRDPHEFALALLERHDKLGFRAGSKAAYSNLGYLVLGEIVAAASGLTYEDYVRTRILAPLGMSRTGFSYAGIEDVATGYQPRFHPMTPLFRMMLPKGIINDTSGRFVAFRRFYVDGPAYGGLVGSSADAARFMAAHLNHGEADGHQLLTAKSTQAMQSIRARGRKMDVGFGWYRRGRNRRTAGHLEHLGGGGGFWTMMRIYPDRRLGIVTMGNVTGYDQERIAAAVTAG